MFGSIFAIFACVGLFLSATGIYGDGVRGDPAQPELGVRIALEAKTTDIVRAVASHGVTQVAIGLMFGIGSALGLTGFLKSVLVQITPTDPTTFAGVAFVLTSAGLPACMIPARHALRLDPAVGLRYE